jgi:transcriptional regulator with XRE-family HTH domain
MSNAVCYTGWGGNALTRQNTDFGDTQAAAMLRTALTHSSLMQKISQRELAKLLGYKQSAVLSHMALGRVPIPIERVEELAEHLDLDPKEFLIAVLKQRFKKIDWDAALSVPPDPSGSTYLLHSIEAIADSPMGDLTPAQKRVMREVAADPHAERRWLSVHEVQAVQMLRELVPELPQDGLSASLEQKVRRALRP